MRTLLASLVLALTLALVAPAAPAQAAAAAAAADRAAAASLEAAVRGEPGLRELYGARQFVPLWSGAPDAGARRSAMLGLLGREQRLAPAGTMAVDRLSRAFAGGPGGRPSVEAEVALTRAALGYLERRAGGRPVRAAAAAQAIADLGRAKVRGEIDLALAELRLIEGLGGWAPVRLRPAPSVLLPPLTPVRAELELSLPPEERPRPQPEVPGLRRRLVQSFDLGVEHLSGEEFDPVVTEALQRFQARHGLQPDGVAGARTVAVLNQSVSAQIRQVELNLARPGTAERAGFRRYIEVNVPGFDLKLVENGRVAYRSRIIVGDQETPTPLFDDWMRYVELNPSWSVPRSIVKEILDKEAKEPGYMSKAGFTWRASGEAGVASRLVQRPGPENALGQLKFVFPNRHAVYIHDTPNRGLFSRHDRTLSHGCVRLEKPMGLAAALLGSQGWEQARIEAALATPGTRRVRLDSPVPVFLDYRTATLDADGRLQLWSDIYGLDAQGIVRFPTKGLPPEQEPAPPPPAPPPAPALPRQETVAAGEPQPPAATGLAPAAGL